MTVTAWFLLSTLAIAGVLVILALLEPLDRDLRRRPAPLPKVRPEWSTDPRMHLPRHALWAAPLGKDSRYEVTTRRIHYRLPRN